MGPLVTIRLTPVWYSVLLLALDQAGYIDAPGLLSSNLEKLTDMIYEQGGTKRNHKTTAPANVPPAQQKTTKKIRRSFWQVLWDSFNQLV